MIKTRFLYCDMMCVVSVDAIVNIPKIDVTAHCFMGEKATMYLGQNRPVSDLAECLG